MTNASALELDPAITAALELLGFKADGAGAEREGNMTVSIHPDRNQSKLFLEIMIEDDDGGPIIFATELHFFVDPREVLEAAVLKTRELRTRPHSIQARAPQDVSGADAELQDSR